jgi:hypothetical protein
MGGLRGECRAKASGSSKEVRWSPHGQGRVCSALTGDCASSTGVAHRGRFQPGSACISSGQQERKGSEAVTWGCFGFHHALGRGVCIARARVRSSLMVQNTGTGRGTVTMMVLLAVPSEKPRLSYAVIDTHVVA